MPRKPRFLLPGVPVHLVQRGNNRQAVFFADEDRRAYLGWLAEASDRWGCAIHAYVLMSNHVHLLATPTDEEGTGRMMQHLGRRYVPYINRRHRRSGTLWEGRYRASLVDSERYLLVCHRYIESNPVRAGMVKTPAGHPWSSYGRNATGAEDPLVTEHPLYTALGVSPQQRRRAYRELFRTAPDNDVTKDIRACLQSGTPLGSEGFRERIERTLGVAVGQARRGRPRRAVPEKGGRTTGGQRSPA
jgi:putative transposase